MVRLLLALAIAAVPSSDGISAFAGGRVKSHDGAWTVWAPANDPGSTEEPAIVRLNGPGVHERGLMPFERSVDVVWPQVPGRVVLVERTVHRASVHVFTLSDGEIGADRIQPDIERGLGLYRPRLDSVTDRRVSFGRLRGVDCVLVEETGMPPGSSEGSLLARRAAFRLDLVAKRAVPVRSCPGARLAD